MRWLRRILGWRDPHGVEAARTKQIAARARRAGRRVDEATREFDELAAAIEAALALRREDDQ